MHFRLRTSSLTERNNSVAKIYYFNFREFKGDGVRYFRIKNWEKYQSRDHKKTYPWIKSWISQLDDDITGKLSNYDFGFWHRCCLYAARMQNLCSINADQMQRACNIDARLVLPKLRLFAKLGLIEFLPARRGSVEDAARFRGEEKRSDASGVDSITPQKKSAEEIEREREFLKQKMEKNKSRLA